VAAEKVAGWLQLAKTEIVGEELTRENVTRQAANLKDFELLPGIKINTGSNDY
jgi:hypothetical protein